jgi:hypothetical protein
MKHMNESTSAHVLKILNKLNSEKIPFIILSAYLEINCKYVDYFVSKPLDESEAKKNIIHFTEVKE